MAGKGSKGGGKGNKHYKREMQTIGISLPNDAFKSVPQTANPKTKLDPGLGAKSITHPFKASKTSI